METEDFLHRVIPATGTYASMGWFGTPFAGTPKPPFITRSYAIADGLRAMARDIDYWSGQGFNVYHALGSFIAAETRTTKTGRDYLYAKRITANVHSLKVFAIDCDVKRQGDNKDAAKCFPDRAAAMTWIKQFITAVKLPRPNLVVDSGYGFHFYWCLETPMPVAQWDPYAEALRTAMVTHGWTADTGSTVDASRILRPPGSQNYKAGKDHPAYVGALDVFTAPDYANAVILQALTPYLGQHASVGQVQVAGSRGSVTLPPRPGNLPPGNTSINQNAGQPQYDKRPNRYANIRLLCAQAKQTVHEHGANQSRDHWRLGDMGLLAHCVDGDQWVHKISDGHATYNYQDTAIEWEQAKANAVGPTLCKTFDAYRPGVCDGCPHKDKLKSGTPLELGLIDADLPQGYRRNHTRARIERLVGSGDDAHWEEMVAGNISAPVCRETDDGGHELEFLYQHGSSPRVVTYRSGDAMGPAELIAHFGRRGMPVLPRNVKHVQEFSVSFIAQMVGNDMVEQSRTTVTRPFGWNWHEGKISGLAIGAVLYRCDGTASLLACNDRKLVNTYSPMGELAAWRAAAALFEGKRPDLQAIIAASFAAPLVALTSDVRGMTANFWSTASGVGKSTAIRVGQSVWGNYSAMQSMHDTPNAVMKSLSGPRILIRYWDEFRIIGREADEEFSKLVFTIPQGKERMRMQSDTTLREVGEWETLLVITSNRPYADTLLAQDDGTDAGVLRLMDIELSKQTQPYDPTAGMAIKQVETNYGHAGRVYAEWVARNLDQVRAMLEAVLKRTNQDLNLRQEERYYATAIATMVTGAIIAQRIGLFDFDVRGIYDLLTQAVRDARDTRGDRVKVDAAGQFDLAGLVSGFLAEMADKRLRTKTLAPAGKLQNLDLIQTPITQACCVHIAQDNGTGTGMIRLRRHEFYVYLRNQGLTPKQVSAQLVKNLGAVLHKPAFAKGTSYSSGQTHCVDIPRGPADLEGCFDIGK